MSPTDNKQYRPETHFVIGKGCGLNSLKEEMRVRWLAPDGKQYNSTIHYISGKNIGIWVLDSLYCIKVTDIVSAWVKINPRGRK